ncbi:MAG TPA: M56 family metallopeptidase [Sedimentisphaerales bacterium]|nr:M56 family metallopeptidase [Sedimentisphaerales bacterium]
MNAVVEILNAAGQAFVEFALPMLIQSGVLILILLAVDAVLRRRVRAVFRYWIWMLVLVKLVLPPSLGSPVSVGTWFGETLDVPSASLLELQSPVAVEPRVTESAPTISAAFSPPDLMIAEPPTPTPAVRSETPVQVANPTPFAQEPPVSLDWQGLSLVIWSLVVFALTLLLIQRAFFVRGLLGQSEPANQAGLSELEDCRRRLGLRRAVALRLSPNATSPAVCGLLRPVILIPQSIASRLQPQDLQAVLLHELAHVKRGDLWINLIQTLLQIAYFYNPLLWLANAMIRRTREQAVDETVLVAMGETASQYPETLVNIAKLAFTRRPALSLRLIGVVESKSALTARIKHILNRPIPKTARLGLFGLLTILLVAAVLLPMAKASQNEKDAPLSRLAVLPNCGVWLSDINGQDLPVLDFPGERIIVLSAVQKERDLLRMTGPQGQGDVLYYYDSEKDKPKITFMGSAGLGGEPVSNEYEMVTITPMQMPFETTVTTRSGGKFDIEIIRADEQACSIRFQPLKDSHIAFKAIWGEGITAELLGVCEHPSEGKGWWRPDGSPLSEAPDVREGSALLRSSGGEAAYEVAVRVNHRSNGGLASIGISSSDGRSTSGGVYDAKDGSSIYDLCWAAAILPKSQESCSVRCRVMTGPWETTARVSAEVLGSQRMTINGVTFCDAGDDPNEGATVTATYDFPNRRCGIRAVTTDGHIVDATGQSSGGYAGRHQQNTVHFRGLGLAEIAEFEFRTRPWMLIEFTNVSLRPGRWTGVAVHDNLAENQVREAKVLLPELDKRQVVLDLATGELVPLPATGPEPQKIQQALRQLGKGDFLYDVDLGDRTLIFLRDARSEPPGEETGKPFVTGHLIKNPPETITVVTKEGRRYKVTILAADAKGCMLKYSPISPDKSAAGAIPVEPKPPSMVGLPNGVTVEFLGLRDCGSKKESWWRPDGEVLPEAPYGYSTYIRSMEPNQLYEVLFRISSPTGRTFAKMEWTRGRSTSATVLHRDGGRRSRDFPDDAGDLFNATLTRWPEVNQVRLDIGVGLDNAWELLGILDSQALQAVAFSDAVINPARGEGGMTLVTVKHRISDREVGLVAVDKYGFVHEPVGCRTEQGGDVVTCESRFELPLAEVRQFRLEAQKLTWLAFDNVSLRPGQKTDVRTATGPRSDARDSSGLVAKLPNGAVVELVGIRDYAGGDESWWRPDGEVLSVPPYDSSGGVRGGTPKTMYEVLFRIEAAAGKAFAETRWSDGDRFVPGLVRGISYGSRPDSDIPREADRLFSIMLHPRRGATETRIDVGVGLDNAWELLGSLDGRASNATVTVPGAVIQPAREEEGKTVVTVSHQFADRAVRLVAVDRQGFIRQPTKRSDGRRDDGDTYEAAFELPPAEIQEVRLEVQKLAWAAFRNVSLEAGKKTAVHAAVQSESSSDASVRAVVLPDVDREAKMLDLATGETLPLPQAGSPDEIWRAIGMLGRGDLVYDSNALILVREAVSDQAHVGPTPPFKTYDIKPPLPVALTVTTAEGARFKVTILAADERGCTLKYSRIPADRGAGGGAPVEPEKTAETLEFRIAPRSIDLDAGVIEKLKQTFSHGGSLPEPDFAWFPIRTDLTGQPFAITHESGGKAYVLLWNKPPHMILASQDWGLESVYRVADANRRPAIGLTFNDKGASLFHDLTAAHVQQNLAIVVEGTVVGMPNISAPLGRAAIITGRFTEQEIEVLLAVLRRNVGRKPSEPGVARVLDVVGGEWTDLGEAIPPDANDTRTLAPGVVLDGIGQDVEGKLFASSIRDLDATAGREYRFVIRWKDGRVQEPQYRTTLDRFGRGLWEKFTFDAWYNDRQIECFQLQSRRAEGGRGSTILSAADEIAVATVGTAKPGPTTAAPPGRYALSFDGQGDYLYVPDSESLRKPQSLTIEMWIKPQFPPGPYTHRPSWAVLAKGAYTGTGRAQVQGFGLQMDHFDPNTGTVVFNRGQARDDGIHGRGIGRQVTRDWIHIVESFDDYTPAPGHPLVFGRFLIPTDDPFHGQIAEIRIWDGRKDPEAQRLAGRALTGNEPGLVACWTFEEGGGPIVHDISPNANHARLGSSVGEDNADPTWVNLSAAPL